MKLTRLRKQGLLVALLVTVVSAQAQAQQAGGLPAPVTTYPAPATSAGGGNVSGTIASTGVFQELWGATGGSAGPFRKGCTVQNNGTHNMNVSEGLGVARSTASNSIVLAAGATYYCSIGQVVLSGEIDITGTSGDAFYAAQY